MRLLVTGARGMLGRAVCAAGARLGHDVVGLSRAELDVTDADHVRRVVAAAEPRAVVNCAAWTDVDGAEMAEGAATAINGAGAGNVARAATEVGARLVHVSTDYVFDGAKETPWVESDPVGPIGAYGRSKLAGELEVAAAAPEHAVVRTAWLFGAGGRNFVDTMLALGGERDEVTVVTDQTGSPTWSVHLAEAVVELAERRGDVGIFHAAGAGACSWYELAVEVFDRAGMSCRVRPTTSERFARPAPRPAYSVLASERDEAPVLPPWQDGVAGYLAETRAVAG
ncbi:MAG: dTDP-4-dehydrorhamnose reductase [Solirubrobacteraceae bacterium]|jgi:dTDP-4-dehydrorhamnose reductase|nr:dTDP-4-dehydrorhamnose reductase [Solirubrobacteraceae bacterium]